ncbi:MAG TPA: hypothetical protein VG737_08605 [Cyclobacteriaceae bacterium]|nr:hypothetical protein [Cyclobacteriaceae bacterium]
MILDEQLQYCRICTNRKMNPAIGLVCSLTDQKPAFENQCPTFNIDQPEADRLVAIERQGKAEEESSGPFSVEQKGIKKGVVGGVIMIVIAIVWFFGGLAAGYIFYYPPILLLIGIYALVKGLAKGNWSGEK